MLNQNVLVSESSHQVGAVFQDGPLGFIFSQVTSNVNTVAVQLLHIGHELSQVDGSCGTTGQICAPPTRQAWSSNTHTK